MDKSLINKMQNLFEVFKKTTKIEEKKKIIEKIIEISQTINQQSDY